MPVASTLVLTKLRKLQTLREMQAELQRREAERLRNLDVFGILGYTPTPRQELFHAATEFDVLYGGAAGGGKTRALLMEGIRACVRYPGIRVGAFRRTFGELEESLLAELIEIGFAAKIGARWTGSKYNLTFGNGSRLMFRYAETLNDASRRQGGQYQLLLFDERNLTPPDVCAFLESRLRSGHDEIPVLGIRSGTNPGGIGHGASKARYVDPTKHGRQVYRDKRNRLVRFIPSKLSDNPHVNAEYATDLDNLPEKLRAAFRDGNWDVFAGQMFSEWRHERHVIKPVNLPQGWQRVMGIDWGWSNPWAALWGAIDPDTQRVFIYREIYKRQVGEVDQARSILAAEGIAENVMARYADDAMWQARGDAKAIAAVYAEEGAHLTEAGKGSRVNGWQRVHTALKEGPACSWHAALGWTSCPMIHVFETCESLIAELPNLPHATTGNVEDADTNAADHACDALRYMLINIGSGASFLLYEEPDPNAPPQLPGMPEIVAQPLGDRIALLPESDGQLPFVPATTGGGTATWPPS